MELDFMYKTLFIPNYFVFMTQFHLCSVPNLKTWKVILDGHCQFKITVYT